MRERERLYKDIIKERKNSDNDRERAKEVKRDAEDKRATMVNRDWKNRKKGSKDAVAVAQLAEHPLPIPEVCS